MKRVLLFAAILVVFIPLLSGSVHGAETSGVTAHRTFVMVHGGWGGGYAFRPIERRLRAAGHEVYRPALVGTGDTAHLANPDIGLETHIQQIVNLIRYEDLHDVVLTGYSYSGMVVTGVVDRIPERIRQVVYIDAFLPEDGESTMSFAPNMHSPMAQQILEHVRAAAGSGLVPAFWESPDGAPPKQDPQPYKTLADTISLKNANGRAVPGAFLQFVPPGTKPDEADFAVAAARAKQRGWPVRVIVGDHGTVFRAPELVADALLAITDSSPAPHGTATSGRISTTAQRANRKVVERFLDAFNRGDLDGAAATFAETGLNHGYPVGRDEIRLVLQDIQTRFPDARLTVKSWLQDGEWIVLRAMYSGTHRGIGKYPVDGGMLVGVPPTERTFEVQTIHMLRVQKGAITEHWANRDDLGMVRQLGLLPPPPPWPTE